MYTKIKIGLAVFFSFFCLFAYAPVDHVIYAASNPQEAGASVDEEGLVTCKIGECTFCDLLKLVEKIFYWLLSLAFIVAVLFVIISGFLYILSIGDSGTMSLAKEGLKYSLIGFAICLCSWLAIHLVYMLLGYKGDTWWQIQCDSQKTSQANEQRVAAELYKNEVPLDSFGGRNNPVALPNLAETGLADLPENKYFFIHGIGGQPLESAAEQIAKITQEAQEQKKIVFAATPYKNTSGESQGTNLIKLNNYLTADQKKTLQNFNDLALKLLANGDSLEVPLLVSQNQQSISSFNNIWPQNPNFYEGEKALYKTLTSMTKDGLTYKETGPVIINWPNGEVPKNFTNFSINLDYDENTGKYILNVEDPVNVTVPYNISPEAAKAAAKDFGKVLATVQKRKSTYSKEEDIYSDLLSLLAKPSIKNEVTSTGESKGNDSGIYRDFTADESGNYYKSRSWESNGTGVLPSEIAVAAPAVTTTTSGTTTQNKTKTSAKDLENQLNKIIKDIIKEEVNLNQITGGTSGSQGGSGNKGGTTSSTGTQSGTGTTSTQESTSPVSSTTEGIAADPNSMVSTVSIGINRTLSLEERGKIRDMIINIQKEEAEKYKEGSKTVPLNIPPEYVLCLIQAESSFKPTAVSPTGATGLGQHTDDSQKEAAEMMKKTAPKHYDEFTKKYNKDLTKLMSSKASGLRNVKSTLARDANLAAAMTYEFIQVKARNVLKINRPVSMSDLQKITYRYVGDGNEGAQWNKIRNCMNNNSWTSGGSKKK